jgi:hypothetical protein
LIVRREGEIIRKMGAKSFADPVPDSAFVGRRPSRPGSIRCDYDTKPSLPRRSVRFNARGEGDKIEDDEKGNRGEESLRGVPVAA